MMNDEPTGKRRPREPHAQQTQQKEPESARALRRDEPRRKPGDDKSSDWRGAGVCGDRHTD